MIQDLVIEALRDLGSAYYIEIIDCVWEKHRMEWLPDDFYFIERYSCYVWEYLIMVSLNVLKKHGKVTENNMIDLWTLKDC